MAAPRERRAEGVIAQEVLAAVMEVSDDAIVPVDRRFRVSSWGTTTERLFGIPAQEAVGKPLDQLVSPHLRSGLRSAVSRAMSGERVVHFESEVLRSDGLPIAVWVSLCPLSDGEGGPTGAVAVIRDVTEQNLAQAALAEVEGRLRDAEELFHVGSWLWDLRTGAVQWSTEYYQIHAVDPFEFDGTLSGHLGWVHPHDSQTLRNQMEQAVESGCPFECEHRILRSDGEVRVLKVRAHPSLASDGSVVGLRGIGQDITDTMTSSVVSDQVPHPVHDIPISDA